MAAKNVPEEKIAGQRNWPHNTSLPRGFTLVELLVVIAIIGVLVALLLPAVQAAREAARRSQCMNNLKQIGLALQNIHGAEGALPQGVYTDPADDKSPGLSWMTRLLPYIEEQNKFDRIAAHKPPNVNSAWEFYAPFLYANSLGGPIPSSDVPVPGFNCPSSDLPQFVPEGVAKAVAVGLATTSYKGSKGVGRSGVFVRADPADAGRVRKYILNDGETPDPIFVEQPGHARLQFRSISDGLSNTIAAAESSYAIQFASGPSKQRWPIWIGTPGGDWDETILYKTEFSLNCEFGSPKSFWEFSEPSVQAAKQKLTGYLDDRNSSDVNDCAYGWHPGGVICVFVDGSVHFLNQELDHRTHMYLGNPSDGQVLSGLDI